MIVRGVARMPFALEFEKGELDNLTQEDRDAVIREKIFDEFSVGVTHISIARSGVKNE